MPARGPVRNPFPVPDVSSEGFWVAPGPVLGERISPNDERWTGKVGPHERLFAHHTLNSVRRDHRFVRNKVPKDALDLALTSTYDHNEDTLVPKMYVCMQPEALGRQTWRVLRNEIKDPAGLAVVGRTVPSGERGPRDQRAKNGLRKTAPGALRKFTEKTEHDGIHPASVRLVIEGPHTRVTNPGYSRKEDGTFYGV